MVNPVAVLLVFRVETFVNRKVLIKNFHQFNPGVTKTSVADPGEIPF
ncbi:MAG TPA: hypothetical protein PK325_04775 [Cyclobacteriaceae bacterium]|nr:hypothetical protein [Cyclobacteriaceae bacterium]HMV08218.1 hypothetical protein [Cyclobacteriaceae bacterium]HMV89080.1 hypothetical protein [Cyclobacteriaceae bacterium]HMX02061.1 hypothetical protein [Cyclobacteriaceae bacterium]HMX49963.1 hypothetical protein [Cyclobacteriaceae bacterium]